MMLRKTFWYFMLSVSVALFVATIVSNNIILLLVSLALAFLVRVKGNKILFGAYDQKRKDKIEQMRKFRAKRNGT